MTIQYFDGANRIAGPIYYRDGSTTKEVKAIYVMDSNGATKTAYAVENPTVSPSHLTGNAATPGSTTITTSGQATAVLSDGTAFTWSSPDAGWSAVNPNSATTAFRKTGVAAGTSASTTFTCAITYPGGTANVTVTASVTNSGSPFS